ncbi:MAG TPA: hypothetical protein VEZ11_10500 [Thermoanaerobaculia bacterium]|nr:hypothetical protein [Thermoanaerobaculia bacterium]
MAFKTPFLALLVTCLTNSLLALGPSPESVEHWQERFASNIGKRIPATENCFLANDRYAACFHLFEDGTLGTVSVLPLEYLGNEGFDWDRSLTESEYLGLIASLSKVQSIGSFVSHDRREVFAVTNGAFEVREEWQDAMVEKAINAFWYDESIRCFNVSYYREYSGHVAWEKPRDCGTINADELFASFRCREPETGPFTLSIDSHDYFLARPSQREYCPGEQVCVLGVALARYSGGTKDVALYEDDPR